MLRSPEVEKKTGMSRQHIWRQVKEKLFPAPVKLGKRAIGWPEADIDEWIEKHRYVVKN